MVGRCEFLFDISLIYFCRFLSLFSQVELSNFPDIIMFIVNE